MGTVSVAACQRQQQATSSAAPPTPGAPPAFGTAPEAGPEISASTFAEAEKLMRVTMTDAERQVAAGNWRRMMAPLVERRVGPRKVTLDSDIAPATKWDPRITGAGTGPAADRFVRSPDVTIPLPSNDADIAFAPVTTLSRWIQSKAAHLRAPDEHLSHSDRAIRSKAEVGHHGHPGRSARRREAGRRRNRRRQVSRTAARHPCTASRISSTPPASPPPTAPSPSVNGVPAADSIVIRRLNDAGAVLIAKLSLGALALNDIWFGGQTMNPWLVEEGASGSSAGPGAATAGCIVGFSTAAKPAAASSPRRCVAWPLGPPTGVSPARAR